MTHQPNLTSLGALISSADPDRLVDWYRTALEPLGARWDEHMLVLGGDRDETVLGFDRRDDVADKAQEPGRQMLCFTVRDIRAAEAHLNSLGVPWIRPPEEIAPGVWFSTVEDPDGNYVQFIQAPPQGEGADGG